MVVFGENSAQTHESKTPVEDRIVIGVEPEREGAQTTVESYLPPGAEIKRINETLGYVTAVVPDSDSATAQTEWIETQPGIRYAEEDYRGSAAFTPDDGRFPDQYAPQMINALQGWEHQTGSENVTIAVLDTGVKYDHEDLSPNMDGSVTNHGRDFVNDEGDPYPEDISDNDGNDTIEAHGTHVAGILGAKTDNATGIAGISDCSILVGKVLDSEAYGYYSDWAAGMQWAADNGADIINMSLGGQSSSTVLEDALTYVRDNGVLPVVAAHNDGEESVRYPAAYPEAVAVSALNENGDFAGYSNYGDPIDITAPGSAILSTYPTDQDNGEPGDDYINFWGTSMATPVVAGVAGLVLSEDESLSDSELETILKSTAVDVRLPETKQGAGRVDALAALEELIYSIALDVNDPAASAGGAIDVSLSAENVEQIRVNDIWTDWQVSNTGADGGSVVDNIPTEGEIQFTWTDQRDATSASVSLDIPGQYVGGEYVLTVTASNSEKTAEESAVVTIS